MGDLSRCVAVVTGASRGAGRGIASVLGEAGATVYVTGRSCRGGPTTENRPETIEETADLVTARGGRAVAMRCDHTREDDVVRLCDVIRTDHGRLDLLVNNVWGGYEGYGEDFVARFWQQSFERRWQGMFLAGVRAHLLTAYHAVPLMLPQRQGLVVSTVWWNDGSYLGNLFYDVSKAAIVRFAFALGQELRWHRIASVAVAPGFMRTEAVVGHLGADSPMLAGTESPEYVGRGIAALAADPDVLAKTGRTFWSGELAELYGFTDVDGRKIPPFRSVWLPCPVCGDAEPDPECRRCFGYGEVVASRDAEAG